MKRTLKFVVLVALIALSTVSCKHDEPDPKNKAEYTIMYYAAGGSNVDQCVLPMVEEFYLAAAEVYDKVNVVVQYKFSTAENLKTQYESQSRLPYAERFTEEYRQRFGSQSIRWAVDPSKTMDEQIQEPGNLYGAFNADCTCPDSLVNFINWAAKNYPAKKYILVMNDHGHGYLPHEDLPDEAAAAPARGMIFDDGYLLPDSSRKHFTVMNFTRAIRSVNVRFETIYMLACMMNNFVYQFELKDLCDYTIASTYVMPAAGGALNVLAEQFAQPNVDVEKALDAYCKADVASWDATMQDWGATDGDPVYTDMTVTRTSSLNALGQTMREFTNRLCSTYETGTDDQRKTIDDCTAHAVKVEKERPFYDGAKYMESVMRSLPEVYSEAFYEEMKTNFNNAIVAQYYSKYLESHNYQVDYSVLLGEEGSYSLFDWVPNFELETYVPAVRTCYYEDGTTSKSSYTMDESGIHESDSQPGNPWGSTLSATLEQTEFDRAVGWSRWLRINRQEPSLFCPSGLGYTLPDGDVSDNPNL